VQTFSQKGVEWVSFCIRAINNEKKPKSFSSFVDCSREKGEGKGGMIIYALEM
jgi:hypothetical protein